MSSGSLLALVALTSSTATVGEIPPTPAVSGAVTTTVATVRPEDARGLLNEAGPTYDDILLFLPRVALAPVRGVLTIVFWPLRLTLEVFEEYKIVEHTIDFLYNDERTAGFIPTFDFFSSQGATFGARAFHDDVLGNGERISVTAKAGGIVSQTFDLSFGGDRLGGSPLWLEGGARYEKNPRLFFDGIGNLEPTTSFTGLQSPYVAAVPTRFSQERTLARLRAGTTHGPEDQRVKIGGSIVYNRRRFSQAGRVGSDERSIEEVYDTSALPGFDDGTSLMELTADLVLDFRNMKGQTSRGFFFEAFAGGVPEQDGYRYFHWGADLAIFVELFEDTRVLVLHGAVEGVEGDRERIPFAELPRLGGAGRLRGYQVDRFRNEKAWITGASYHYPIHQLVRGVVFVDGGRVAEDYDLLFDAREWRYSAGGGLQFGTKDSTWFQIDLAYGDGLFFTFSSAPFRSFAGRTERL